MADLSLLASLPDELVERCLKFLGGHCLMAAATCRKFSNEAAIMKRYNNQLVDLPIDISDGIPLTHEITGRNCVFKDKNWMVRHPTRLTTYILEDTDGTYVARVGHQPYEGPNAWSLFRSTIALPVDAAFTFDIHLANCYGRETKIQLMGGVILRKTAQGYGGSEYPDGWHWCFWDGGFKPLARAYLSDETRDVRPSQVFNTTSIQAAEMNWHKITMLVTVDGITVFEDGKRRFTHVTKETIPDLTMQHLDCAPHLAFEEDLRRLLVYMRNPRVILAEGTHITPSGEPTPPVEGPVSILEEMDELSGGSSDNEDSDEDDTDEDEGLVEDHHDEDAVEEDVLE